jgi:hypothetical protein
MQGLAEIHLILGIERNEANYIYVVENDHAESARKNGAQYSIPETIIIQGPPESTSW